MPDLVTFRGIRYTPTAGEPGDLVAPPYDVIDNEEHLRLCERSPNNVARLILGDRTSAEGDMPQDWYRQAAAHLAEWQSNGILALDSDPAYYLYTQEFEYDGQRLRRKLLLGALRLERYETGHVLPHENTMPGPKADRLRLMRACPANLSPILGFFPDPEGKVNALLTEANQGEPQVIFSDETGIQHELRLVRNSKIQEGLHEGIAPVPLYIADGHHRYETALAYQEEVRARRADSGSADSPTDFILAACMSAADPGLVIRPTHRLIQWTGEPSFEQVVESARQWFHVEPVTSDSVEQALTDNHTPLFVLYGGEAQGPVCLTLQDETALDDAPYAPGSAGRSLPAAVLAYGLLNRLLPAEGTQVTYSADLAATLAAVDDGRARMAGLLPSVATAQVMAIVNGGDRMPPKSTYFWPKPLTGMVLRSLETF